MIDIKTGEPMTRRDFIGGGIAAASAVALAGSANASVRHGLGARLAANFGGGGGGGNPYQTADNALCHMWDGEWNAGFGIHSTEARPTWVDIIGGLNVDCYLQNFDMKQISFGSNYMEQTGYSYYATDGGYAFSGPSISTTGIVCGDIYFTPYSLYDSKETGVFSHWQSENLNYGGFRVGLYYKDADTFDIDVARQNGTINLPISAINHPIYIASNFSLTKSNAEKNVYHNGVKVSTVYDKWRISYKYASGLGLDSQYNTMLQGRIYSVRLYNRHLTDDEIAHNYAVDAARFGIT